MNSWVLEWRHLMEDESETFSWSFHSFHSPSHYSPRARHGASLRFPYNKTRLNGVRRARKYWSRAERTRGAVETLVFASCATETDSLRRGRRGSASSQSEGKRESAERTDEDREAEWAEKKKKARDVAGPDRARKRFGCPRRGKWLAWQMVFSLRVLATSLSTAIGDPAGGYHMQIDHSVIYRWSITRVGVILDGDTVSVPFWFDLLGKCAPRRVFSTPESLASLKKWWVLNSHNWEQFENFRCNFAPLQFINYTYMTVTCENIERICVHAKVHEIVPIFSIRKTIW